MNKQLKAALRIVAQMYADIDDKDERWALRKLALHAIANTELEIPTIDAEREIKRFMLSFWPLYTPTDRAHKYGVMKNMKQETTP